jgi:SAM-dependent methyltransferase
VLEVGCGAGELAAALAREGCEVLALDADPGAVEAARGRGVRARLARFPDFEPDPGQAPFDAMLMVRVLHHVAALEPVCARAAQLLAPGGLLLLEDFAWEDVDRATACWLYDLLRMADARGVLPAGEWDLEREPLAAWQLRNTREHALHPGGAMLAALGGLLDLERVESVPYAYRWLARFHADDPRGQELAAAVLAQERELIQAGAIVGIGLRVVARRRGPRPQNSAIEPGL